MCAVLLMALLFSAPMWAGESTYDFLTKIPAGWTSNPAPFAFESANLARGAQYTSSATLTLKGMQNVSKVEVTCSTNNSGNSISLSVGGKVWDTIELAKENGVVKTFTGSAASGDIVLSITRSAKSIYISKIVVTADNAGGGSDSGGGDTGGGDSGLNPSYEYAEPTVITPSGATGSNTPYEFIQNNVQVSTLVGAQTATYFGCNAGSKITFTATQPIKGLSINGYVKKDFAAIASSGEIVYADASEDYVEADPVLVIYDIDSKSVTISCDKQLRCYSVKLYFEDNPEEEVENAGGGGDDFDFTYDWEPTTPKKLDIAFDELNYMDLSEYMGYDLMDLYFSSDDYEMELYAFSPRAKGTILPVGTYEINATYEPGTIQASPGGTDEEDYPSYIAAAFEYDSDYDDWFYTEAYYLVSGTLTVAADPMGVRMTLNAKTYYGSTVSATFVGKGIDYMGEEEDDDDDAIKGISAEENVPQPRKFMQDGKIFIRMGGHTYQVSGMKTKR